MSSKSRNSRVASGAFTGAGTGATIGTAFTPGIGTAIGAGAGALLGGVSGFLADQAETEDRENDPEYQAAKRRERAMQMMSQSLGRAFAGMKQARMGVSRGLQA